MVKRFSCNKESKEIKVWPALFEPVRTLVPIKEQPWHTGETPGSYSPG